MNSKRDGSQEEGGYGIREGAGAYFRQKWRVFLFCGLLFLFVQGYFFLFIQNQQVGYLLYLDLLLCTVIVPVLAADYLQFRKSGREKEQRLRQDELICCLPGDFANKDIAEHDVQILTKELDARFRENCDLQDFVAKWCHELKLPLSALLFMDEKIADPGLRRAMREQLEKMNQQLSSMLLGCRLQGPLLDLQIREVHLPEWVKASIRNNRFFLIRNGFELTVEVEELTVYTDPQWLVYMLDQLIQNAVKYGRKEGETPVLRIWTERREEMERWEETERREEMERREEIERREEMERQEKMERREGVVRQEGVVKLYIEDHGQGIQEQDMGRIFEKGYTGSNYHNGKYKSTGLGLYMVQTIARRLGHPIQVESRYGEYCRFTLEFRRNTYFV